MIDTQTSDGYIGNYAPDSHLNAWDIWDRKYCMLGLLSYYNLTKDTKALNAAAKEADFLMQDIRDAQLPNGLVTSIAPEDVVFNGGFLDSPNGGEAPALFSVYLLRVLRRQLADRGIFRCNAKVGRLPDHNSKRPHRFARVVRLARLPGRSALWRIAQYLPYHYPQYNGTNSFLFDRMIHLDAVFTAGSISHKPAENNKWDIHSHRGSFF